MWRNRTRAALCAFPLSSSRNRDLRGAKARKGSGIHLASPEGLPGGASSEGHFPGPPLK